METSSAETGSSQTMNCGSSRQRAGDADALAAAAVQLMRIAVRRSARASPTVSISSTDAFLAFMRLEILLQLTISGSAMISRHRHDADSSEAYGS